MTPFWGIGLQLLLSSLAFVCTISLRGRRDLQDLFVITSTVTGMGPELICSRISGLSPQQITICHQKPRTFTAIEEGYRLGAKECENQFKYDRWNCSSLGLKSAFGERAIPGTREAAFTQAIMSAAVTHRVTQACSVGNLSTCNCDDSRDGQRSPKGWTWGGCSADVKFGEKIASDFVAEVGHDRLIGLMNAHNSQSGREVVSSNLVLECKCHGVSASCSTQTCWKGLRTVRTIGNILRKMYIDAVKVSPHFKTSSAGLVAAKLVLSANTDKKPTATQLVFLNDSKDYCVRDDAEGILGTEGRRCNKSSVGEDSCTMLCCGRGYDTYRVMMDRKCSCKFHWCCYVKCKICSSREEIHKCK